MERVRRKSSSRAVARKIARNWRRLLAAARSCGTPWNSADNAQAFTRSQLAPACLLAQSCRRICFIPGDEGHRRTPKRPRTRQRRPASQSCGSSSQLGHHCPLDVVRYPDSSGQQPHPAALILSGNAPTTNCASRSPSTRHRVLSEAEHPGSRAVRQSSPAATRDDNQSAPARSSSPRVRHCHRRSRESDAQLPQPQLSVTARRVPRAEHVTPASATDAIL